MKKWLLFFGLFIFWGFSSVQTQDRIHELGLRLSGLEDFDFIYKKSDDGIKFKRYRIAVTNINLVVNDEANIGFSLNYARGIEKRKNIGKNIRFIHGFEPGFYFGANLAGESFVGTAGVYLGYVLGFQYNISEHFYVNIETIPSLSIGADFTDFEDDTTIFMNAGFNSNAVALTLAYTFNAPKK